MMMLCYWVGALAHVAVALSLNVFECYQRIFPNKIKQANKKEANFSDKQRLFFE